MEVITNANRHTGDDSYANTIWLHLVKTNQYREFYEAQELPVNWCGAFQKVSISHNPFFCHLTEDEAMKFIDWLFTCTNFFNDMVHMNDVHHYAKLNHNDYVHTYLSTQKDTSLLQAIRFFINGDTALDDKIVVEKLKTLEAIALVESLHIVPDLESRLDEMHEINLDLLVDFQSFLEGILAHDKFSFLEYLRDNPEWIARYAKDDHLWFYDDTKILSGLPGVPY